MSFLLVTPVRAYTRPRDVGNQTALHRRGPLILPTIQEHPLVIALTQMLQRPHLHPLTSYLLSAMSQFPPRSKLVVTDPPIIPSQTSPSLHYKITSCFSSEAYNQAPGQYKSWNPFNGKLARESSEKAALNQS